MPSTLDARHRNAATFARRHLALVAAIAAFLPAAAPAAQDDPATVIAGQVRIDQPLAEPDNVWLLAGDYQTTQVVARTRTDLRGRFRFERKDVEDDIFTAHRDVAVVARRGNKAVGWVRPVRKENRQKVVVDLHPTRDFHGRLLDTGGKPVAGVEVQPDMFVGTPLSESGSNGLRLPDEWSQRWAARSDADGRFTLPSMVAESGHFRTTLASDRHAKMQLVTAPDGEVGVTLPDTGSLAGEIDLPDDAPESTEGSVWAYLQVKPRTQSDKYALWLRTGRHREGRRSFRVEEHAGRLLFHRCPFPRQPGLPRGDRQAGRGGARAKKPWSSWRSSG